MATRRNSFLMLLQVDQKRALDYLSSCLDQIGNFGDILQLVIVELIYKASSNYSFHYKLFETVSIVRSIPLDP